MTLHPAHACHVVDLEVNCNSPLRQDTREKKWRVQAVSVQPGSFENRRSLPAAWRGLRDEELSGAAGIPGDCACHDDADTILRHLFPICGAVCQAS